MVQRRVDGVEQICENIAVSAHALSFKGIAGVLPVVHYCTNATSSTNAGDRVPSCLRDGNPYHLANIFIRSL